PPPRDRQPQASPQEPASDWDAVDQASWESFPASDPPGWGSQHAVPNAEPPTEIHIDEPPHRRPVSPLAARLGRLVARLPRPLRRAVVWALQPRRSISSQGEHHGQEV